MAEITEDMRTPTNVKAVYPHPQPRTTALRVHHLKTNRFISREYKITHNCNFQGTKYHKDKTAKSANKAFY